MPTKKHPLVVAGIDVGASRKGFHAVALRDCGYHGKCSSKDVIEIVDWCRSTVHAQVIAVDAPCRWNTDGRARPAERELMRDEIWCFSTPTREAAVKHRTNNYGWMLNGEELFRALEPTHSVCRELPLPAGKNWCFETFPHAITCALEGLHVSARNKRKDRVALLLKAGIDITELTNIDLVDAALCALVAHRAASGGPCKSYGDAATGLIIVPIANGVRAW